MDSTGAPVAEAANGSASATPTPVGIPGQTHDSSDAAPSAAASAFAAKIFACPRAEENGTDAGSEQRGDADEGSSSEDGTDTDDEGELIKQVCNNLP